MPIRTRAASTSCFAFAFVGLLYLATPVEATPVMQISGATLGCFGEGCTATTTAASADHGFTFTAAAFDVFTDTSGAAGSILLGTVSRSRINVPDDFGDLPFSLEVAFIAPAGLGGGLDPFTVVITGKNSGGGGPVDVEFDNSWRLLSFTTVAGALTFEFSVQDLQVSKNSTENIFGSLRNLTFTPATPTGPDPLQDVPEPATTLLLAAGVAAALLRRRSA